MPEVLDMMRFGSLRIEKLNNRCNNFEMRSKELWYTYIVFSPLGWEAGRLPRHVPGFQSERSQHNTTRARPLEMRWNESGPKGPKQIGIFAGYINFYPICGLDYFDWSMAGKISE